MAKKWRMDPTRAYNVPLCYSWGEMAFKWFHKKICPACGYKLDYTPYEEDTGKKSNRLNTVDGSGFGGGDRDVYDIWYYYTCPKCGGYYSLEELAEIYKKRREK
jgi:hypothetical protein